MPPAISDDEGESDGPDMIPAKGNLPSREEEEMEVDDDEDEDEEEYRVEKILKHDFDDDGSVIYQIKWLGYDKKSDLTWEPIANLANAEELLDEYHNKIGEVPTAKQKAQKKKGPKGKRSASTAFADSPAAESSTKKGRKSSSTNGRAWSPPDGLWETHVTRVSSIIEETDAEARGGKGKLTKGLYGLLEWNDGRKTQFPLDVVRTKCPQKLLDYYEQHLVFRAGDSVEADEE